jgi:pyridoxal phosphate enzyme (YggS family)
MMSMAERLEAVETRIAAACRRASRPRGDVKLVAVTKTVSSQMASRLVELGVLDLGENRPQELWRKAAELPANVRWHLIGHLQRNKVEKTLPLTTLTHSADSLRILQAIDAEASKQSRTVEVLLECNASGEAAKQGFALADVPKMLSELRKLRFVRIAGLMTMAAYDVEPEKCRPTFASLRRLRDALASQMPPPHQMVHLSMGMSNDFEVAIEEGATMVRLGTVLFDGLAEP